MGNTLTTYAVPSHGSAAFVGQIDFALGRFGSVGEATGLEYYVLITKISLPAAGKVKLLAEYERWQFVDCPTCL